MESDNQTKPRGRGRPARARQAATMRLQVRVTPEQHQAWERLGGTDWLLPQLDAAARLLADAQRSESGT